MPPSEFDTPKRPRSEAAPVDFKQLTSDQQRAGEQAAELLSQMAESELHEPLNTGRHSYLPEIDPGRNNHVVLIDGQRGSGKSQLMLTLLKAYRDAALNPEGLSAFGGKVRSKDRIIPVGLIDLQPLPADTSLVLHILGQLERVVRAMEGEGDPKQPKQQNQRVASPWSTSDTQELPSRKSWRKLARTAPFGWGGNLEERKAQLDPESYAVEMEHGELQRLDAMYCFRMFMDELVSDYRHWQHWGTGLPPFFLLTIDDADMNPRRSAELLELVRKLWHRRLGFLLTGDSGLFIAKLQMEFRKQLGQESHLRAQQLSADVYSKIVPAGQRCRLPPIKPGEALNLPASKPLGETLKQFPLGAQKDSTGLLKVSDLAALLSSNTATEVALPDRFRDIISLNEELSSHTTAEHEYAKAVQAVFHIWQRAVDAAVDAGFEAEPLRNLVRFVSAHNSLTLDSSLLTSSIWTRTGTTQSINERLEYTLMDFSDFEIRTSSKLILPPRMSGAFLIAHEFVRTHNQGRHDGSIVPKKASTCYLQTKWTGWKNEQPLTFSWMAPAWDSFLDFQHFAQNWRFLRASISISDQSSIDRLAWAFLKTILDIAGGIKAQDHKRTEEVGWAHLGASIAALSTQHSTPRSRAFGEWALQHASQLATPEAGTSSDFANKLLDALANAPGWSWRRVRREQTKGRMQRMEQATQATQRTIGAVAIFEPIESADSKIRRLDNDFPDHPYTRRVSRASHTRASDKAKLVDELINDSMSKVEVPLDGKWINGDRLTLASYFNPGRRLQLAAIPARRLERARSKMSEFKDFSDYTSYAVIAFWEVLAGRERPSLKPTVSREENQVVLSDAPLRHTLHRWLQTQWKQQPEELQAYADVQALHFHLSPSYEYPTLIESFPAGLEAVLRTIFDYSVDQDDLIFRSKNETRTPNEWWPAVKIAIPGAGVFAPWPAISWPTLWEWEELQRTWVLALKSSKKLRLLDANETVIRDALALWLVEAFQRCAARQSPGNHLYLSRSKEQWTQSVMSCESRLRVMNPNHQKGKRAQALRNGARNLILLATPEAGLSVDAAQGILDSREFSSEDIREMNQLRVQRMLAAGIAAPTAGRALRELDKKDHQHPWVKKLGAFRLPLSRPVHAEQDADE